MHGIRETIDRGICIGCGACAFATDGAFKVSIDRDGMFAASGRGGRNKRTMSVETLCVHSQMPPSTKMRSRNWYTEIKRSATTS